MADDEQFSLCWNNFGNNLSAGFHESLIRGDLVDVTLAAEGQVVKAHRLVLSVCSPYFRQMFTQMPANQHAFVFMKDVSHSALKDLIQFMYCGEVNVKQDALPAFISTAEALQIKGLTDNEQPPSPAKPSTPAPMAQPMTVLPQSRRVQKIPRATYKIESEDSSDEKATQIVLQVAHPIQSHKRAAAQRSVTPHTTPLVKRVKNNDPLEAAEPTQITVQTVTDTSKTSEPEFVDLPIEIPTKAEPEYADGTDVDGGEQDTTYVEDESYGEIKYDENYFTETDETGNAGGSSTTITGSKVAGTSYIDSYSNELGDQSNAEAQDDLETSSIHKRKRSSLVWNYFEQCEELKLARCKLCNNSYKTAGNTTNLHNHLQRRHPEKIQLMEKEQFDKDIFSPYVKINPLKLSKKMRKKEKTIFESTVIKKLKKNDIVVKRKIEKIL